MKQPSCNNDETGVKTKRIKQDRTTLVPENIIKFWTIYL
jgi:hypothetical protein